MTFTFSWNQIKLVLIVLFIACSLSLGGGYYLCWTKYRDAETLHNISMGFAEFRKTCSETQKEFREVQILDHGRIDNLQTQVMKYLYPKAYDRKILK